MTVAEETTLHVTDLFTTDQRAELEALADSVRYPLEHTVFWEGQPSFSVLIIREGTVKVTRRDAEGNEIVLAIRGGDQVIGEEGVLMDEPRSATVTTITEVTALTVRAEQLLRFVEERKLWRAMYQAAVRRRRQLDERLVQLREEDVGTRLARCLLDLVNEIGVETKDGWVIESSLSQRNLATRITASRDSVAQEFRKLRKGGLVTTKRRRIVVKDVSALRDMTTR
jgi:CRP/FNR family cyclic AMP-dependent transcriptional regulator